MRRCSVISSQSLCISTPMLVAQLSSHALIYSQPFYTAHILRPTTRIASTVWIAISMGGGVRFLADASARRSTSLGQP